MADRLNVALMVGDIDDSFTNEICRGAMRAAADLDMNLFILPGRYMHDSGIHGQEDIYEYQYNVLFDYADMEGIDAVIAAVGTICSINLREDKDRLLSKCGNIPTICLVSREDKYPVITYDNATGIKEAIEFLVNVRGCSKIGMLSGDLHNDDARERKQAYEEALREHGFEYDENRVAYGHLIDNCEKQVRKLLDDNPDLEAIVSANDEMAKSIYRVCAERNIQIGKDLYVVGYDDEAESCRMDPPLASVRADAAELGYQAMIACFNPDNLRNAQDIVLKTRFINRESTGKVEGGIDEYMVSNIHRGISKKEAENLSSVAVDYFFHASVMDRVSVMHKKNLQIAFADLLFGMFGDSEEGKKYIQEFGNTYKALIDKGAFKVVESSKLAVIAEILGRIRCELYWEDGLDNLYYGDKVIEWIRDGFEGQAYGLMNDNLELRENYHLSNLISRDILSFSGDAEQSYLYALEKFNSINIPYALLGVWDQAIVHKKNEEWKCPNHIMIKAINDNGKCRRVPRTKQKAKTHKIFKDYLVSADERFTAIALDIFDRENQLGLLLCKIGYEELMYAEFLTYQVSMAVKTIRVYQRQKEVEKQLEETLEKTRSLNVVLDNESSRDELTGLYNRRGFYRKADKKLELAKGESGFYLVAYADLDYLKTINDNYGHDEGDFAIKGATEILKEVFGEEAIIGRVGGDEFVILEITSDGNRVCQVRDNIAKTIRRKNTVWRKPYRVSVSVGIQEFPISGEPDLKLMIEEADDLLYEQKKSRTTTLEVLTSDINKK